MARKKRNIWPWVLGALAVVYFLFQSKKKDGGTWEITELFSTFKTK
jgi:hypothetical protein